MTNSVLTLGDIAPIDPAHRRTEATIKGTDGKQFKATKGAAKVILGLSADKDKVSFGSFLIQDALKLVVYKYVVPELSLLGSGRRARKAEA